MKTKKPFKLIVCVAVSLAMMCTPVFGSYSYLANAHGVEDQVAASEQSDQGALADQANQEDQSGNEETPAAGSENVEEATEPGTERDGTAE